MTKKYLRMTLNERLQHINLAVNFTLLVITGFALSYSTAFWVSPITDLPMGMTFRGFLHRLCGVATVFLGGYHLLYLAFTPRGRGIVKDMIPGLQDAKDLLETLKNNFFINRPAKELKMPRFSRPRSRATTRRPSAPSSASRASTWRAIRSPSRGVGIASSSWSLTPWTRRAPASATSALNSPASMTSSWP